MYVRLCLLGIIYDSINSDEGREIFLLYPPDHDYDDALNLLSSYLYSVLIKCGSIQQENVLCEMNKHEESPILHPKLFLQLSWIYDFSREINSNCEFKSRIKEIFYDSWGWDYFQIFCATIITDAPLPFPTHPKICGSLFCGNKFHQEIK